MSCERLRLSNTLLLKDSYKEKTKQKLFDYLFDLLSKI